MRQSKGRYQSYIVHSSKARYVYRREDYLDICEGNDCAAQLLDLFEFWTSAKLSAPVEVTNNYNNSAIPYGGTPPTVRDSWLYERMADLKEGLLKGYGEKSIRLAIKLLKKLGFILTKPCNTVRDTTLLYRLNIPSVQNALDKWAEAANIADDLLKDEVQILTHQPDLQPNPINPPHHQNQVEILTVAKIPCQKSDENSLFLASESEMAETRMVVDAAFLPGHVVKPLESQTSVVVGTAKVPSSTAKVPSSTAKVPSHYLLSNNPISNPLASNLQRVREDEDKDKEEEGARENANQEKRQNTNPDNPESRAIGDVWEEDTQELTQPTAVNDALTESTQERKPTAVHSELSNNTQESIRQTGNFSFVGQKESEIFHKQIDLQLDQNCAGGAAAEDILPTEKNEVILPKEKNKPKKEELDPRWVKKWRQRGELDERFLGYVTSQMSKDKKMPPRQMAEAFILKNERTIEGIELLQGFWERWQEGIGVEEWKSPDGEIFPWFLSLVIDACYHSRQGNTIEAATIEATKHLRNRNTAAVLWERFKHRVKGEGDKIEQNKALGVTGYVPPSWMREQKTDLADVQDAVQKINESTSLPAPKLKEAANKGLETAATSVDVGESTRRADEENKQVVGDFKGSNGNSECEANGGCTRSERQVTGLSGSGEMARAVAANVAVVESPAAATEMEVNETADDADVVSSASSSAAATAVVNEQVSEREGMPTYRVHEEQLEGMKKFREMLKAQEKEREARRVNGEVEGVDTQPVREKTHFEKMNKWIKSGDNVLKNEAMKWALGQDNIEFEHDDEGKVVGIVEKRN